VYRGGLYIGTAPLEFEMPIGGIENINAESPDGKRGTSQAVVGTGAPVTMTLTELPDPNLLERRRRQFYGSNTRFWISLPVTLILMGMSNSYADAYASGSSDLSGKAAIFNIASKVAIGASAGFFAETLWRFWRYVLTSNKNSSPISKYVAEDEEAASATDAVSDVSDTEGAASDASEIEGAEGGASGLSDTGGAAGNSSKTDSAALPGAASSD